MSGRSDGDPREPLPPQRNRAELTPAAQENRLRFAKVMRLEYEWLDSLRRHAEFHRRSGSSDMVQRYESAIESTEELLRQGVEQYPEFADRELVERLAPTERKSWKRWFLGR